MNKHSTNKLKIWYTNINGITSKLENLITLMAIDKPHVIILTETKTKRCPNIPGYTWISQTKPNKAGGVAVGTRNDITEKAEDVDVEKEGEIEIAWIRLKTKIGNVYIGGFYGKQEGEKLETVEHEYSQLNTQMIRLARDGHIVLAGDFNAKLPVESGRTPQKESRNGKILQRTLTTTNTEPINVNSEVARWTRVNRNNTDERSIIDYILVDKKMKRYMEEIQIDEEGNHRPKGKNETDHNTITVKFNISTKIKGKAKYVWDINKSTDWDLYNKLIENRETIKTYDDLTAAMKQALTHVAKKRKIKEDKRIPGPL